ncbi:MAG: type II toxin-antitoxin system PemK/MazF family toxin, partial [Massilistercora timonensis]
KTKLPTHVPINGISGLEKESFVLLEQIRTVDKSRLDDYVGRLNRDQMNRVEKALRTSMEIKKLDKPILMCLCPVCAKPFYNSKEHFIIRADQNQTIKETCMFCNVRQGYDYLIRKKYY